MPRGYRFAREALEDLQEIDAWVRARHGEATSSQFLANVGRCVDAIVADPDQAGRKRPAWDKSGRLRFAHTRNGGYIVVYRESDPVVIVAVVSAKRDLARLMPQIVDRWEV